MKIENFMTRSPKSCQLGHTLRKAARLMRNQDSGWLLVTARSRQARGWQVGRAPHSTALMLSPLSIPRFASTARYERSNWDVPRGQVRSLW